MADTIFVKFGTCGPKGQYTEPFAICVRGVRWHGLVENAMLLDLTHEDGTNERIRVHCERFGDFHVSSSTERIIDITVLGWAYPTLTKDQFHERVGKGMFLHPTRGHFVEEGDLP